MDLEKKAAITKLVTELKLEGKSNYTIRNYTRAVEELFSFANKKPESLTVDDARDYLATLFDSYSTSSISLRASAVRYFYSEILDQEIGKIKLPKRERLLPETLTKDEVYKVIVSAPTKKSQLMIELMYTTGMRVSEIVSLQKKDIDFNTGRIRVKGKGKKMRQLLAPPNILAEIKTFSEDKKTYIFSDDTPLTTRNVQYVLNRIYKKLQLNKKITPHVLRHSYATHLLEDGVDIRVIQALLGHKNLATTEIYTQVTDVLLKTAEANIKKLERPRT